MFSLSDQLASIELCNDTFQNFVDNGRKDSFIIVLTKFTIDLGKVTLERAGKNTTSNVDHLKI